MQYEPSFETFKKIAALGTLIPVSREILADTETPVSTVMKLSACPEVFLLESVEGGEKWGRYSFLGCDPRALYAVRGESVEIRENGITRSFEHGGDPLKPLQDLLKKYRLVTPTGGLPRFFGGAVGYLGYDMVRFFEKLPRETEDDLHMADALFLVADDVIIFDNLRHTITVSACACVDDGADLRDLYEQCRERIDGTIALINAPPKGRRGKSRNADDDGFIQGMSKDAFISMVDKAVEYIRAGDAIQVVLSQRFEKKNDIDTVSLYRALRFINPSPYLFYFKSKEGTLIGSSPEVMVRLESGIAELRPIAGTRKRGASEQEDRRLADELLNDPKERAEHVMLVDLGRNDLGRIARTGSVQVTQLMAVERYSHVMHLVSTITAQLEEEKNWLDLLAATFPAGTLAGAPKIRAMEIIEELERVRRGPYGGAVGYVSFEGSMDLCITIRTILVKDEKLYIQTGAGIVADSDSFLEYEETLNKAAAMMEAVRLADREFSPAGERVKRHDTPDR
ncbi:MAG: anthranilate synthase [delta proteobacterium MLS_D]|jgi:anthranilate synthase component I|nr:MAG: anthranilate synthase [delta proteobacterium MLS_D]